jgi:hypothetical protein
MAKGDLVYIESPYAQSESGSVEEHVEYTQACLKDCLERGEHPFASHLLYPQVLDDLAPAERRIGMEAGKHWAEYADLIVVYEDQDITKGMSWGIANAEKFGTPIEYRRLYGDEDEAA